MLLSERIYTKARSIIEGNKKLKNKGTEPKIIMLELSLFHHLRLRVRTIVQSIQRLLPDNHLQAHFGRLGEKKIVKCQLRKILSTINLRKLTEEQTLAQSQDFLLRQRISTFRMNLKEPLNSLHYIICKHDLV